MAITGASDVCAMWNNKMMSKGILAIIMAVTLCATLSSCGDKGATGRQLEHTTAIDPDGNLQLPYIPDNIRTPESRAAYLASHFWDTLDFKDSTHCRDTLFMEQTFANYSTVLLAADSASRQRGVQNLLTRAANESHAVHELLLDIADRYLFNPGSPLFNEDLYLPFADYLIRTSHGEDVRAQERREIIMQNRPGTAAPDFDYISREGKRGHIPGRNGTPEILMFYDPDCDECRASFNVMAGNEALSRAIDDGAISIMAIYNGSASEAWMTHAAGLPQNWMVGRDADNAINENDLYSIRATPSFYLIDGNGKIMMKDATLAGLFRALNLSL